MTYREAFVDAVRRLSAASIPTETPELDTRVLLGHVAGLNHAGLLARWPDSLPESTAEAFAAALDRRLSGEPVAWITGFKEFLGMDFEVGPGLLVPRADTETLVEAALGIGLKGPGPRVLDVCTGTGCVAVGLAALAPRPVEVWACDISLLAVETARRNAARLLASPRSVTVVESDLMSGLTGRWDLIVSNPPYLTPQETLDRIGPGAWKEPALALDGGGEDGLDLIRRLVTQASATLNPGGWLLLEASPPQFGGLRRLFEAAGFGDIRVWSDLGQNERVIGGSRA